MNDRILRAARAVNEHRLARLDAQRWAWAQRCEEEDHGDPGTGYGSTPPCWSGGPDSNDAPWCVPCIIRGAYARKAREHRQQERNALARLERACLAATPEPTSSVDGATAPGA